VAFTDFYWESDIPARSSHAVEILEPVNIDNNVAALYKTGDRDRIVAAACTALDALNEARFATKGRAIECWQAVPDPRSVPTVRRQSRPPPSRRPPRSPGPTPSTSPPR